jgi:cobyrinic acid a,c-diamide synthase
MPQEVCADLFYHGSRCADVGLVDGRFGSEDCSAAQGGSLDTLCEWLDLPQVAVIDVTRLALCNTPLLPAAVQGIVLDNVAGIRQLCELQTWLEALYGVPVLGVLKCVQELRAVVATLRPDSKPSAELCSALGNAMAPHFQLARFLEIAAQRAFSRVESGLFRERMLSRPLSIAVAHDEAFRHYFPDTFDVLESQGATVNVFSPLRSESLPNGTDVVYLGCGQLERHVGELAANVCLKESLWSHVLSGGRVYAEGAGLAYLCREIVMPCGRHWSMAGLLPALARRHPQPPPDRAVEVHTGRGSWLFPASEMVRGYLDSKWIIHPDGSLLPLVSETEHSHDLVGDYRIVGSRIHLNFAARPDCVDRFFQPCQRAPLNTVS